MSSSKKIYCLFMILLSILNYRPKFIWHVFAFVQEFKCEICGNHSYWGRRAFERHFKEWRHQHGMRCLNIPNTKNFNEITSIQVSFLLSACLLYMCSQTVTDKRTHAHTQTPLFSASCTQTFAWVVQPTGVFYLLIASYTYN